MSRFSDLRKKDEKSEIESLYFRHLVIGNDIFTIAKFFQLKKQFGDEVALVCDLELKRETLIPRGPTTLRGKQNIELFKSLYPNAKVEEQEKEPMFFKEKEWRSFKGRMKPEKLLYQEEFFMESGANIDLKELFDFLDDETVFEKLNDLRFKASVKNLLHKEAPYDLVQPAKYCAELADGKEIGCEKLYWGLGPDKFVNHFKDPGMLSDQCIEYCERTQTPAMLVVAFQLSKQVGDLNSTKFIPLSYTHEWGHFIGEFLQRGDENWAEFICYVDPNHSSEQDLVKKIHLLKRSLDKIYENFSSFCLNEQVLFVPNSPCLKIDDKDFLNIKENNGDVSFVSYNAPLGDFLDGVSNFEYSDIPVSFFSRGISSLHTNV